MSRESPSSADPTRQALMGAVLDHWHAVFRLIYTLGGDVHEAEDLTQETFLRALDRLETFQAGTNLKAWLLRIATNAYFDEHRKKKRTAQHPLPDNLVDSRSAPGTAIETHEQAELARVALEELTELTRLVFHLRVQEELSFREIAELAGTTEESARWHMHHARTKLLARLRGTAGDST